MKLSGKSLLKAGLAGSLVFGAGCGSERAPELTEAQHITEIERLTTVRDLVASALSTDQQKYLAEIASLSKPCKKATEPYLPPDGEHAFDEVDNPTSLLIESACSKYGSAVVAILRSDYQHLVGLQSTLYYTELSLAGHVDKLGIDPPATQG